MIMLLLLKMSSMVGGFKANFINMDLIDRKNETVIMLAGREFMSIVAAY